MAQPTPTLDRRQRRRQESIEEIINVALELMAEQGVAGLSLGEIARRMGIRPPSLYVYFESKTALYDALFADGYRQLLKFMAERDYVGDPRDALVRFVQDQVEWAGADFVRFQMLFQRAIPGFEPSPESWALALEFYETAAAVLRTAGLTRQSDVDLFSALIWQLKDAAAFLLGSTSKISVSQSPSLFKPADSSSFSLSSVTVSTSTRERWAPKG